VVIVQEGLRLPSVLLGHEVSAFQGGLVVVLALVFALEQFFPLHLLVGNEAQEVRDAVEARPPLENAPYCLRLSFGFSSLFCLFAMEPPD
jgi:hypothetical protein